MLRVKRGLKKARLFEIQKLTRRLKMLEKKRGTQAQVNKNRRKAERLLEELEFIKDLSLSDLAAEVLRMIATEGTVVAGPQPPSDLSERARWRLLSSNVFRNWSWQEAAQRVVQRERLPESEGIVDVTGAQLLAGGQQLEQELPEESEQDSLNNACTSVVSSEDHHSGLEHCSNTPTEQMSPRKKRTRRIGQITMRPDGSMRGAKRKVKSTTPTCDSVPESRDEGMSMDSIFLDCLAVGRVESQPEKRRKPNQQKRRNRPGQRARQKEWEALYGTEARHLLKEKHCPKKKSSASKGSWVAARHTHRGGAGEQPASDEASGLHPSWAASRKRKAEEGGIVKFQGQRVVFSDSD